MDRTMERILYDTAALTFEELGFLLTSPSLSRSQQQAEADAAMRVAFHGPLSGHLTLRLCGDMLPVLAANMLGEDASPSFRLQHDALGEVANILCGNVLPLLSNTKAEFHLSAPALIHEEDIPADTPTLVIQVGLEAHGRADVFLRAVGP